MPELTEEIEAYRDHFWQREESQHIENAQQAEAFIERVGFCNSLTDMRQPGASLYVSVCGRRDAQMPRNVQKDPEASLTWTLKDEIIQHGKVYYGKLAKGRTMFVAPRMLPYFYALFGIRKTEEKSKLSPTAQAILKILRKEYESASIDLRKDAGIEDRVRFNKAMDELQSAMIIIPSEVVYAPKFTYIWTLSGIRFPNKTKIKREDALCEVARCFLQSAGMTVPGELAKVSGLSRPDAGLGNRALVTEGFALMPARGNYVLTDLESKIASIRDW